MGPKVEFEERDGGGRLLVRSEAGDSELTFSRSDERTLIATRTYVPNALRGQGIALALLSAFIDYARRNDCAIVPACSYVAAKMRDNPAWRKLITRSFAG